jgi:hypothetical protein
MAILKYNLLFKYRKNWILLDIKWRKLL